MWYKITMDAANIRIRYTPCAFIENILLSMFRNFKRVKTFPVRILLSSMYSIISVLRIIL